MDDPNSKEAIIGNQSFILQFEFNTQNFAETFFLDRFNVSSSKQLY